jgi:3-oxoadipate enol-lactonase
VTVPHASSAGCRIWYDLQDDRDERDVARPPLVMIRGLSRSSRYWGPLIGELAPHFRLLLVDNRGVGRSDATRPPYTTRQLADDVAAVMDAAGLPRAHVFGMSLGGMIAQHLAHAHPQRVDRLVLGCTTPGGSRARVTPLSARLALLGTSFGPRARRAERLLRVLVSEASLRAQPELLAQWAELLATEPAPLAGLLGQVAAALRHDATAQLAGIAAPTLVITGDDDVVIPPWNSRLLAESLPRATLTVLPGARHDFTTDRPAEAAQAIRSHLFGAHPRELASAPAAPS